VQRLLGQVRISAVEAELRGSGLTLRIWEPGDERSLAEIVESSREQFAEWIPNALKDLSDVPTFLDRVQRAFRDGSGFFYAIQQGSELVGQCSLRLHGDGPAEIGYWIRTDRTGRSLATKAVALVTDAAFSKEMTELVIYCDEGNLGSAAVARKAGYDHIKTVALDPAEPNTESQTGREMTWIRRRLITEEREPSIQIHRSGARSFTGVIVEYPKIWPSSPDSTPGIRVRSGSIL
jgi:RimJ/RimL family protein N-acetyltransferase